MGNLPRKWEIYFRKKINIYHLYFFTEDYNLLKFYDITMILIEKQP